MSWTDMTDLTGLFAWYKADAIVGLSDGDPVSTWLDSGPGSLDLTGSGAARPTYKTGVMNGQPVVRFGGSHTLVSPAFSVPSGITAAIVYSHDTNKDHNTPYAIDSNVVAVYPCKYSVLVFYASGLQSHGFIPVSTFTYRIKSITHTAGSPHLISHRLAEPGEFFCIDGKPSQTKTLNGTTLTPPTGTGYIHVGNVGLASGVFDGDIAELILWSESAAIEQTWVEGYLADKYAITLASGHLFRNAAPQSVPPTYNSGGSTFSPFHSRVLGA